MTTITPLGKLADWELRGGPEKVTPGRFGRKGASSRCCNFLFYFVSFGSFPLAAQDQLIIRPVRLNRKVKGLGCKSGIWSLAVGEQEYNQHGIETDFFVVVCIVNAQENFGR